MAVQCPGCGKPAEFRLRVRLAEGFHDDAFYLCEPDGDDHAYAHRTPPEQAVTKAYPWEASTP